MCLKLIHSFGKGALLHSATACILAFTACQRSLEVPSAESEILTPLLHAKLTIEEIVPDSLRTIASDGAVTLNYRSLIYSSALASFRALETKEFNETAKLQSLVLASKSTSRSVSLGQIATAEGGVAGQLIISQHGSNAIIPPMSGLSYGPLEVDGTSFFESVTLDSGYMDVTLHNQFPTALQNIEFELRNSSDSSLIGSETFASVPAGGQVTRTINLAGKSLEGNLYGDILNFDIAGTGANSVPIDTSDQVVVTITVRDMKVFSATAIFPAQNII
jgi:hypothetical protein